MGSSAHAHLYFGYDIGSPEQWHIQEIPEEFGPWHPAWVHPEEEICPDDYGELVERRLLEVLAGFTEVWTCDSDDGYDDRRRAADAHVGVKLQRHGYDDTPQYVLAVYSTKVEWGDTQQLDFADLDRQRLAGNWDAALERAVQALGITPTQPRGWLIAASYG